MKSEVLDLQSNLLFLGVGGGGGESTTCNWNVVVIYYAKADKLSISGGWGNLPHAIGR